MPKKLTLQDLMTQTNATTIVTSNGFLMDGTLRYRNKRYVIMVESSTKNDVESKFFREASKIIKTIRTPK